MPPPTCCYLPHPADPALDRWRLGIGVVGTALTIAYLSMLPSLVS